MMRQLDTHLSSGGFNALHVSAVDHPHPGYANHRYDITGINTIYNPAAASNGGIPAHFTRLPIIFHSGPQMVDQPLNGVTPEALLLILADHLHGLQNSPDACVENQMAMEFILNAKGMLEQKHQPQFPFANYGLNGVLQPRVAMAL